MPENTNNQHINVATAFKRMTTAYENILNETQRHAATVCSMFISS